MASIQPVGPPFEKDISERLDAMMPPEVPPILLFRTFVRNLPMAKAMGGWWHYELSRQLSLSMRDREIIILRTCARCGCEYEWGVHVAFFDDRVGLLHEHVASLTHGQPADSCWRSDRDRILIEVVDSLHDTSRISDDLWTRLSTDRADDEILDVLMLTGWDHAISFTANGSMVPLEKGAPQFRDAL